MLAIAAVAFALLAPAPRPALLLVGTHPVRVHGTSFRAGEAIRVTVRAGAQSRRTRTAAGRRGAFTATIRHIAVPRCTPFTVTAVGASGDRARARMVCIEQTTRQWRLTTSTASERAVVRSTGRPRTST